MTMFKPVHPGRILKDEYLEELGLTVTAVAKSLNVTRQTLDAIINERAGVSPEMSLRLAKAFDTTPELWLNMQRNFDLWKAKQNTKSLQKVKILYRSAS
jgi:addiction module HigA family antidote